MTTENRNQAGNLLSLRTWKISMFVSVFVRANWAVCLSTCVTFVYASFYIAYAEWKWCKHLLDNRNSIGISILKTTSVIGEVHPLNLTNELLLFLFFFFFNIWYKYSWANKTCQTKTLFTNFTRCNCFPQLRKNLFIILKVRSHAKYLHFCELNMKTRKSLRVVSLSASSLVVYCL